MAIDRNSQISRASDVISAPLDDEMVLMGPTTDGYVGLDRLGRCIWELLAEPSTVAEICDDLITRFDVSRWQCEEDVLEFLRELESHSIIVVSQKP